MSSMSRERKNFVNRFLTTSCKYLYILLAGDPVDAEPDPPEEGGPDGQEPGDSQQEQERRRARPRHGDQQEAQEGRRQSRRK